MSIQVIGDGEFVQVGTPRWTPGGLTELDALELVYQGAYTKLAAYRATLNKWTTSRIDGGMFLESFPDDGDPIKPKVTLRYIGLRGGQLPVGKQESGSTVQSASSTKTFSGTITGPGGTASGVVTQQSFTAEIVYYSPTNTYTWISGPDIAGSGGAPEPASGGGDVASGALKIISIRINGGIPSQFTSAQYLRYYFEVRNTSVTHTEELVPGRYFRNTNIRNRIYIPTAVLF